MGSLSSRGFGTLRFAQPLYLPRDRTKLECAGLLAERWIQAATLRLSSLQWIRFPVCVEYTNSKRRRVMGRPEHELRQASVAAGQCYSHGVGTDKVGLTWGANHGVEGAGHLEREADPNQQSCQGGLHGSVAVGNAMIVREIENFAIEPQSNERADPFVYRACRLRLLCVGLMQPGT